MDMDWKGALTFVWNLDPTFVHNVNKNSANSFSMESGGFIAFFEDENLNAQVLTCINMQTYNEILCVRVLRLWALGGF